MIRISPGVNNIVILFVMSKAARNTTAEDRVQQYAGKEGFHADNGKLFCSLCNMVLDHTRKCSIDRHVGNAKHQAKRRQGSGTSSKCDNNYIIQQYARTYMYQV